MPRNGQTLSSLTDLETPWCIHVVATLQIAEHIAAGSQDIDELAATAGCDARALNNVLEHLVSRGVFSETAPGRFAVNELAGELLDPAARIGLDLDGIGGRMAYAWGTLLTYVQTGAPGYHQVFGRPFWEDLDANQDIAESFDALIGPTGHGTPSADFGLTGGWDAVRTVVDVGGGTGSMLAEILRTYPSLRGTLVDLPRVVARSAEIFEKAGVAGRVTTAGQSFFDPLPAGADLYLLKRVLNDWPDRETGLILGRCAAASRPDGRVVVMGGVAPADSRPGLNIETVLLGGTTSPLPEFEKIARANGLEVVAAGEQRAGFVVECAPV
jgi:hypothetical protein